MLVTILCSCRQDSIYKIPNVFECTYIKKDLCKDISYSSEKIPNPLLDSKNILTNPEICLSGYPFSII